MEVTYTEERQELLAPLESPVFNTGVVDLIITPPIDITRFILLLRNLLKIERIKILSTDGSYDEKSVIRVLVEKPLPLLEILLYTLACFQIQIPSVALYTLLYLMAILAHKLQFF